MPPRLVCPLCRCMTSDDGISMLTVCGHTFCSQCINIYLGPEQHHSCPVCSTASTADHIVPVYIPGDVDHLDEEMKRQVLLAQPPSDSAQTTAQSTIESLKVEVAMLEKFRTANTYILDRLNKSTGSANHELKSFSQQTVEVEEECFQTKATSLEVNLAIERAQRLNEKLKQELAENGTHS